ncbi:MAG: hypothetical protein A2Z97_03470 [Bdellovibrionales bacterium GWB1_52_6]|nr:MAG: hypothetical protein A2Z97_03470 [Bdellovibrionales bacterium GWB1_52_6]OFZ04186.1 MAG: hypothetical protein A2X97_14675 [Bdellovibrionales bacterium GWA1_52_35]
MKREFEANRRILSFDEYLAVISENPERHTRGSAHYLADMMDHFGKEQLDKELVRFTLFDHAVDGTSPKVAGQESVQNHIYRALRTFGRQGINNKLILLHGPNGSAKSSIAHSLMGGMERYSHELDGAVYTFNWVFPLERYTKSGMGLNALEDSQGTLSTYAKLPDEEVSAQISCDMKDHPLLLVPTEHRYAFLEKFLGAERTKALWEHMPIYLRQGDLCHRCREVFDALLEANHGDYAKLLMHIRVERFYFARRYRRGVVTIEPQLHVDAQYHQLTYNKGVSSLPASLQSLNLFALTGDLIEGNRGLIEFSDLLKRPIDSFKYLLGVCETGAFNVGNSIAYLDTVMIGSSNELQLDSFKEFPDFTSFKARIELVRVPYLLTTTGEQEIYSSQLPQISGEKHVAPNVAWAAALWAVLTRLKKPNSVNYAPNLSSIVSNITPLEKAKLYDTGEIPAGLSAEDRKTLRANLQKIRDEYTNIPYYEGRIGASAREIKAILFDAAQNPEFPCLSPLAVLREMENFVKHVSEYEFLKQEIKEGFHDTAEFINGVTHEYLNRIDREVRDAMGLYNVKQWEEFLKRYVQQISLVLKKEKAKNPITGRMEDPEFSLIEELEGIVGAPAGEQERDIFRHNVISQIGAWSLDHPGEAVVYSKILTEFWQKLEKHYFESQKALLSKMYDAVMYDNAQGGKKEDRSEGAKLAQQTINNLVTKMGYCEKCAKEVITFLMRRRY